MNHSEITLIGQDLLFRPDGLRLTSTGLRVHTSQTETVRLKIKN